MKKSKQSPRFTKVLVPVDFSPHSERALGYGSLIGKKFDAAVVLMHVVEFPYTVTDSLKVIDHRRGLEALAKSLLDNFGKMLREEKVRVRTFLADGAPHREILRKAEEERVDLIVMGTHGRTGLERLVMGSVAEKVVRMAACPVMTVPLSGAEMKGGAE